MYMKNFDTKFEKDSEYEGLKKDGKFWFPHAGKYVAWFILVACIVTSSVILILYGMHFGMIKTYIWMGTILTLVLQSILLIGPIRIMIISFIKGACLKLKAVLIKRPVSLSDLSNPYSPLKKKEVLNFRKYNAHLYNPIPLYKLQSRIQQVKYNVQLRNLTVDFITYIFFLVTVFYIVLINKTPLGYFSTNVMENLVVRGSYTNSIPFTNVTTYDTLLVYLNKTLLPALLVNYKDYNKKNMEFGRKLFIERTRMQRSLAERDETMKRETVEEPAFFDRGWTLDPSVKLIGKVRIRQVRVRSVCEQHEDLPSRNVECAPELSYGNEERRNFTLRWDPWSARGLTPSQEEPWIYKTGWETKTLPIFAKFSTYPWGGYILNFGRGLKDSRIVLEFLDTFQWIDMKTRGIFIEFTTYCVNVNVFSVVTLIAEKSATGYIIPSYQIGTCQFLFKSSTLEVISLVMILLFSALLFFFTLKESLRIHKATIKTYYKGDFAVLNVSIIFFGVLSLVFMILRSSYVEKLMTKLEKSDNNEFVSFIFAAHWHTLSIYIEAFLVCLASFKVFRLLTFRVIFFQLQITLFHCCKQFVDLVFQIFVLLMGFALFFYLCLIAYAYCFSNVVLSFSTMIGRSALLDDTFDFTVFSASSSQLPAVMFALYVIVITIMCINLFIAVICLYFSSVRKVSFVNKYSILRYVKHALTSDKKSDLLQIQGENRFQKSHPGTLRLKGGGSSGSKKKTQKMKAKCKRKKLTAEEEGPFKIHLREFVRERHFEIFRFKSLTKEKSLALKYLAMSALTEDEDEKICAREKALLALFATVISRRRPVGEKHDDNLFVLVLKSSGKEAVKRRRLLEMKKAVEEFGKEKGWIAEESYQEWNPAESLKNEMNVLCEKVNNLLQRGKE